MFTIQTVGIMTVLLSTGLLGVYFGNLTGYRIADLKQIRLALTILHSEIEYTLTPLPIACRNISGKIKPPISQIFLETAHLLLENNENLSFQEAFEKSVLNNEASTYLIKEDIDMLLSLGESLGDLDKFLQLNNIALSIDYIDKKIEEQNPIHLKNKKLYQTLGILSGLLVVVLLI